MMNPDGLPNHQPPDWFEWAVAQPRQSHQAPCGDSNIHYVSWNAQDKDKPAMLFGPGFLGHTHWWDFIAPFFTSSHRVYALDFAGMGQSGHRTSYARAAFSDDIAAVIAHAGIAPITYVGHSFGGSIMMYDGCVRLADQLNRVIVVDSFAGFPDDPPMPAKPSPSGRVYPSREEAAARFRLMPTQPCAPWLLDYLAKHSMREVEGGWAWRFDPGVFSIKGPDGSTPLDQIHVPFDYIFSEDSSVITPARAQRIVASIPGARRGFIGIPGGQHHLMLDQPLALIGTLRALLA